MNYMDDAIIGSNVININTKLKPNKKDTNTLKKYLVSISMDDIYDIADDMLNDFDNCSDTNNCAVEIYRDNSQIRYYVCDLDKTIVIGLDDDSYYTCWYC